MKLKNEQSCNSTWIELKYIEWNLISNPIQFNNWIKIQFNGIQFELKTNGMQIGGKIY